MAELVKSHLPFWEIRGSFEPWSSQTNDYTIDTGRFLAKRSELLGYGKDCFAQCQVVILAALSPSGAVL